MARVPEGKRIRSFRLSSPVVVAAAGVPEEYVQSYTFLDDCKVIGCVIGCQTDITDAASNADGQINGSAALHRSGDYDVNDGVIAEVRFQATWNGLLSIVGDTNKQLVVEFPDGCGWEFDEGEVININGRFTYVGGIASLNCTGWAVIYWVER